MNVKFKVIFQDNTELSSHDEMYNPLFDHAHFLAPYNIKPWKEYQIISDAQHVITVNFLTGCFTFNGIEIQPEDKDSMVLAFDATKQNFPVSEAWKINNNLPYFPIAGRRIYKGDLYGHPIDATVYYCGWKRKKGDKTIEKIASLYPNGKFTFR